jgi:hypothetical protein
MMHLIEKRRTAGPFPRSLAASHEQIACDYG